MRFATAVAILANTLPAASVTENANIILARAERRERIAALVQEPPSGRGALVNKLRSAKKSPLLGKKRRSNQGILKNEIVEEEVVKCNPSSSADVGVLSCGVGHYCMESDDSELGGFCHAVPMDMDRQLQGVANDTENLDWTATDLCNSSSPYFGLYDCDCENFDISTETGTVVCITYDGCLASYGCNDTCVTSEVDYTVRADGSYLYEICYDFSSPYEQTACYAYDGTGCSISLDDVACNSCEYREQNFTFCPAGVCSNYTSNCTVFDCTNAIGMNSGNSCYGDVIAPILGVCYNTTTNCSLCGDGEVTNLDGIVNIPSMGSYTCGDFDALAESGYVDGASCPFVQGYAEEPCCKEATPMPSTAPSPGTPAPAEAMPTIAPALPTPALPTPATIPPPQPTSAPQLDTPEPTPSGVPKLVSSKNVISLVGLSMAMTVYFTG
jgi:hypothetical protein